MGRSSILPGALTEDRRKHVVEPVKNVVCGESEHAETGAPQISVPKGVLSHGRLVRRAVDLNHQPGGMASEVDDKRSERHRSAKLVAAELVTAKSRPEQ